MDLLLKEGLHKVGCAQLISTNKENFQKVKELQDMTQSLQHDNTFKELQIRNLTRRVENKEMTIAELQEKLVSSTLSPLCTASPEKVNAEVMTCESSSCNLQWNGAGVGIDPGHDNRPESVDHKLNQYQENIDQLENKLRDNVHVQRMFKERTIALNDEVQCLKQVCGVLQEQCRSAAVSATWKDEIIHELRRQLNKYKEKATKLHFGFATSTPKKSKSNMEDLSTLKVEKETLDLILSSIADNNEESNTGERISCNKTLDTGKDVCCIEVVINDTKNDCKNTNFGSSKDQNKPMQREIETHLKNNPENLKTENMTRNKYDIESKQCHCKYYNQDASTEKSQNQNECNKLQLQKKVTTNTIDGTTIEKLKDEAKPEIFQLHKPRTVISRNICSKNDLGNISENTTRNEMKVCQTKYCFCRSYTQDYIVTQIQNGNGCETIRTNELENKRKSFESEQKNIIDEKSISEVCDGTIKKLKQISEEEIEIQQNNTQQLDTIHEDLEVQNFCGTVTKPQDLENNIICGWTPGRETEKNAIVEYRAMCECSVDADVTCRDEDQHVADVENKCLNIVVDPVTITPSNHSSADERQSLDCAGCCRNKVSARSKDDIRFSDCSSVDQMDYMQNKLVAMVQLLKDKEEMVEICERSLSLEGERVAQLMARLDRLQGELDLKTDEIQSLRAQNYENRKNSSHCLDPMKTDSYRVLCNNLSVIENLYRDYFFESVRQDEMIDLLRNSCLEIRLRECHYTEEVDLLKNMLYTQRQSFKQQDNWEQKYQESFCDKTGQELKEILTLLNKLQNILRDEFNMDLKCFENYLGAESKKSDYKVKLSLQQRIEDLEKVILARDETIENLQQIVELKKSELEKLVGDMTQLQDVNTNLSQQVEKQKEQLSVVRDELQSVSLERTESEKALTDKQKYADDQCRCVEGLKAKLKNMKAVTKYKTEEVDNLRTLCKNQDVLLRKLKGELCGAQLYLKENSVLRNELVNMRDQMLSWPKQFEEYEHRIEELEVQLQAAYHHLRNSSCTGVPQAEYLQQEQELVATSSRGRALCAETRHIACDVRQAVQQMRDQHEQLTTQVAGLQQENRLLKQHLRTARSSSPLPFSPTSSVSSHSSHSPTLPHSPLSPDSPANSNELLPRIHYQDACDDFCQDEELGENNQQSLLSKCLKRAGHCTQRVRHNNTIWKERLGRYRPQ